MNRDLRSGPGPNDSHMGNPSVREAFYKKLEEERQKAQEAKSQLEINKGERSQELQSLTESKQESIIHEPVKTLPPGTRQDEEAKKMSFTILGRTFEPLRVLQTSLYAIGSLFSRAFKDTFGFGSTDSAPRGSPEASQTKIDSAVSAVMEKSETIQPKVDKIEASLSAPQPQTIQKIESTLHPKSEVSELTSDAKVEAAKSKLSLIINEMISTEGSYLTGLNALQTQLNSFLVKDSNPPQTIPILWTTPPPKSEAFGKEKLDYELLQYIEIYNKHNLVSQEFKARIDEKIKEKGGNVNDLTPNDLADIYNDDKLLSKYAETIKDCAAIKAKLDNLILNMDFVKTFPDSNEIQMTGAGGKINILKGNTILPVQRMPRHVLFLEDLVKTNDIAYPDGKESGPINNALGKVKSEGIYINVESGILIDRSILEDLRKTLESQNLIKQLDVNKILEDINTLSKSDDPSIMKAAKTLLSSLEQSKTAMQSIRDDEKLMATFHKLTASTFKDLDALKYLLDLKASDNESNFGIDKNGDLTLKTKINPDAIKLAEEILEKADKHSLELLNKNAEKLRAAEKNSVAEKRLLGERELLDNVRSKVKEVDSILGISVRKQNNELIGNLEKAIESMHLGSGVVIGNNGNFTIIPNTMDNKAEITKVTPKAIESIISSLEVLLSSKDVETRENTDRLLDNFNGYVYKNMDNINWGQKTGRPSQESPLYLRSLKLGH